MKYFEIRQLSFFIQSVVFSLLMMSCVSLAQDLSNEASTPVSAERGQVNINRADATAIARVLAEVGIIRAEAIVSFWKKYGDFASMEDLLLVSRVGEVTLRNNQKRISFD